jgi:pyruvate kinase
LSRPTFQEAFTKIIATVGPACQSVEMLVKLIEHGVDIFRINTAHGTRESMQAVLDSIRAASRQIGFQVGVLLDLAGPKIRLGQLAQDPLGCEIGQRLTFVRGETSANPNELTSSYKRLIDELKPGNSVMLADGTVALRVESVDAGSAKCVVVVGGTLRSRQGINLPGVKLSVSSMRPQDVDNAIWGAKEGIDFISLSFVRTAEDVHSLKNLLSSYESSALVIAKIEMRDALTNLEEIINAADGVMVARGDLGVEIDVAETPAAQKRIIRICREKFRPVIVATQMLESMHHNRRPTRAEATDVANAILDGADACMLSGETAIGNYPLDAVQVMHRILRHTEQNVMANDPGPSRAFDRVHPITSAVTTSASTIAQAIQARLLVVATRTGGTAWVRGKQRGLIPTLGVSDREETLRRMNLFWGVKPLRVAQLDDPERIFAEVEAWGLQQQLLVPGDRIVFIAGKGVLEKVHNLLVVHTVADRNGT